MLHPQPAPSQLGPEYLPSRAKDFGVQVRLQASHGAIHLHQYDCMPGGWRHDALTYWRIVFQQSGCPRMQRVVERSSERQWRPAGKISISPPNAQSWSWDSKNRVAILFISQDLIDAVAREAGMDGQLLTPLVVDDDLVRHTILEMLSECAINSRATALLMDSAGHHVVAHLFARFSRALRESRATGMAQWKLKRALDYIEENIGRNIGLEELATNIDMTPHYFCRAFRQSVGIPPYRYLISRRIERSKELLTSTDKGLTEIALEVGFADHAHFSTAFRRAVGHSPSTYRNSARK